MESHDSGRLWSWRCGKQFVTPTLHSRYFLNDIRPDFTHYVYPGIYEYQGFHHCGLEPNDTIVNYDNAVEVWTCQLDGLAEYAFRFDVLRFYSDRRPAWQQRTNMFARRLQITRMTSSLWESMAYAWMRRNV
jgi:hypothetical protein